MIMLVRDSSAVKMMGCATFDISLRACGERAPSNNITGRHPRIQGPKRCLRSILQMYSCTLCDDNISPLTSESSLAPAPAHAFRGKRSHDLLLYPACRLCDSRVEPNASLHATGCYLTIDWQPCWSVSGNHQWTSSRPSSSSASIPFSSYVDYYTNTRLHLSNLQVRSTSSRGETQQYPTGQLEQYRTRGTTGP